LHQGKNAWSGCQQIYTVLPTLVRGLLGSTSLVESKIEKLGNCPAALSNHQTIVLVPASSSFGKVPLTKFRCRITKQMPQSKPQNGPSKLFDFPNPRTRVGSTVWDKRGRLCGVGQLQTMFWKGGMPWSPQWHCVRAQQWGQQVGDSGQGILSVKPTWSGRGLGQQAQQA